MASRGFLGQLTSCLLIVRGKLQLMRRRQLLIILAIFAVAATVWQMEEISFFRDLKMGPPNSPTPETSGVAKKTAFEAVSIVSEPDTKNERGNDENPNVQSALHKTESDATEDAQEGEAPQSLVKDSDSIGSGKDEREKVPESHDTGDKDLSGVADNSEQNNTDASGGDKMDAEKGSRHSEDVETANTREETGEGADASKDNEDNPEHEKSMHPGDPDKTADKTDAKLKEEDRLVNVDDNDVEETSKTAKDETAKMTATSESDGTRNETDTATIDTTQDVIRNLHTKKVVKDIGYRRTKCYSVSGKPHEHSCAPSVVVAGYEKCGTSALYHKLAKHPEIVAHPKWNENCPTEDSQEAMWSWFENNGTTVLENSTSNALLLNGCIGIVSKPLILRELQRLNPDLKVLAAFRNYADWSYSFYGYRCYPGYDKGCEELEKPNSHGPWKETRNPENFAKLVKAIDEAGKSPYEPFGVIEPNVDLFRQWLEELVDIVGRKAVKIIKQEDLSYSPKETLASVAAFLDVDAGQFPDEAYTLLSNTNDHPAEISWINETASKAEISAAVNSGAVVLNETRILLNKFWKPECEWLRDNFDIHYSDAC